MATITPTWQDVNRINYFTPRFQGLQIGVGYAPKINLARGLWNASGRVRHGAASAATTTPRTANCPTTTTRGRTVRRRRQLPEQVRRLSPSRSVRCVRTPRSFPAIARSRPANLITGANLTRGSSGCRCCSSASPASRSVARQLRQQRPRAQLLHRRRQRHPHLRRGIMYETGPWQMSFMWAGSTTPTVTARRLSAIAPGTIRRHAACGGVPA
jgi:hypothetical protein